jgi:hypothetical protein
MADELLKWAIVAWLVSFMLINTFSNSESKLQAYAIRFTTLTLSMFLGIIVLTLFGILK